MASFGLVAWISAALLVCSHGTLMPEPEPDSAGGTWDTSQYPAGDGANSDTGVAQSDTNSDGAEAAPLEDLEPGDCLAATFLQAGISRSVIPRYLEVFRNNDVDLDTLAPLSVDELAQLLTGPSFRLTSASDTFYLHKCMHDAGACVAEPFCWNGGSCVHVDMQHHHACRCAAGFEGAQCQSVVMDPEGDLLHELKRFQRRVASSGPVYTRWGNDKCNDSTGASLLYNGWMAGTFYNERGGSATPLCLPNVPEYGPVAGPADIAASKVHFAEFETQGSIQPYRSMAESNPACSVCQAKGKRSNFMFPARQACPRGWTLEYHGYIFAERDLHRRSSFLCIDSFPVVFPGTESNINGYLLYQTEVSCAQEMDCSSGRYDSAKELTCAVCSR